MKKRKALKWLLMLYALFVGVVSTHADDYDYEWVETSLSDLQTDDVVVIADDFYGIALPNNDVNFKGVSVELGSNNNKITGTVSEGIQWKLRKNDNNTITLLRNNSNVPLAASVTASGGELKVGGSTNEFTNNNRQLSCTTGGTAYYIYWWIDTDDSYYAKLSTNANEQQRADFIFYKRIPINYVKWKRVDGSTIALSDDDDVVVADLATGRAMSNDKKDKDPDAVAVTLNDDQDRIIDEVPEKVQWTFTKSGDKYQFAVGDKNLYADSEGLKVGSGATTNNEFDFSTTYKMGITIEGTQYYAGVDASMFSNVWQLVEGTDDIATNTQVAIFKKVVDSKKIAKIGLPEYYSVDKADASLTLTATITGAPSTEITWSSSDKNVATVTNGVVTLKNRGTAVITASVEETDYHDKASAKCTVVIDDKSLTDKGSKNNPFTVAEAKAFAEAGSAVDGVNYYIKGKVSKVNSGMMAMFGDMDFGAMMENMGGNGEGMGNMNFEEEMDDMDFDMEDMEDSGFDMSSMGFDMSSLGFDMSAMFGTSDKVTYYISDDGTKDGQMKVINGCGTVKEGSTNGTEFNPIPTLSPGDCVVVCGPLVKTEDTNMFSSLMGNNNEEPTYSGKVDELNYLFVYDQTLYNTEPELKEVYVNRTLNGDDLYTIDNEFNHFNNEIKIAEGIRKVVSFKSSDEEIAKWDETNNKIVGVQVGKAKITVKVKVVLQEANENANPKVEEKSYTMKRKFKVNVLTRDLELAGYYDGDYVLTTSTEELSKGTRLILAGTRVKEGKEDTDYIMVENNSMMGGGKNGSKIDNDKFVDKKTKIPCANAPKGTLEVVLEDAGVGYWYLNVGEDENGTPLYLYASEEEKEESQNTGNNNQNTGGFNIDEMMEMFNSSSGLKVGTMANATVDSLKATINITDIIATIQFPKAKKNNIIMLGSSFDMESIMNMMGGFGEKEETEDQPGDENESTEEESTFDMSSFDMFMAAFNTKKLEDAQPQKGEDGETKAPKFFLPRIYRFVPYESFDIEISSAEWKTIVTYKDVEVPQNVEAYIVTDFDDTQSLAILHSVGNLKGGEPYLLHSSQADSYKMYLSTDELTAPEDNLEDNLLEKSDRTTTGTKESSTIYVLANKTQGVGFYRWVGEELGANRVYLPVGTSSGIREFVSFDTSDASGIVSTELKTMTEGQYYMLDGRLVETPTKGLYIVNGKKVVIK